MGTTVSFNLPENLTIANIHGLHEQLEALVDKKECDSIVLTAEAVQRADTAGLQLLLAFVHASRERQIDITWDHPSQKLRTAADILGLSKPMGIN